MYDTNAQNIQISAGLSALVLVLTVPSVGATPLAEGIGVITAVQGQVTMAHPQAERAVPAKIDDNVLFKDIIETQSESRTKALFDDDTLLTVGEHSRVEITEHIYDPSQNRRSLVVKLVRGKLRALISKVFDGSGSKFEIHTPTAVAAARGTYFVVWVEGELSGVVNIGTSGRVDFTSGGQTVSLAPGQFSVAPAGATPMLPAAFGSGGAFGPHGLSGMTPGQDLQTGAPQIGSQDLSLLGSVRAVINGTELTETPRAIAAIPAVPAIPAIPERQRTPATPAVPATSATPAVPATPPAVISGAFPGGPPGGPKK